MDLVPNNLAFHVHVQPNRIVDFRRLVRLIIREESSSRDVVESASSQSSSDKWPFVHVAHGSLVMRGDCFDVNAPWHHLMKGADVNAPWHHRLKHKAPVLRR